MGLEHIQVYLNNYREDIRILTPIQVVRKHILLGECCILGTGLYFDLRSKVAEHFNLHPNEVLVVGSAKLGFSIAPGKRYRHFCDESDIDITLVSSSLFDKIWQAVYQYSREGGYWEQETNFKNYLYRGWIRPDKLPPSQTFILCKDWWEFFRELTSSGSYGPYKISGALYKSWFFLENYQGICVQGCKDELRGAE